MGVVYEAEQESLGRRVALKVLPAHLLADDHLRARFLREAQAAARLHHTNIVPVFAVGEQDGMCFYVMQLIAGRSLDRVMVQEALPAADVARIGVQVADALAYAHSQGVLHRDIKPSNLLLDDRGAVWVTDFGVAKLVEEANLTRSGDLVGTLRYMPPERFAGQSDAGGDVYSLGVTLYELLAGRPPFPDTTPHHLIQLITQQRPAAAPNGRPRTSRADLETIVLKAAARDAGPPLPGRRPRWPTTCGGSSTTGRSWPAGRAPSSGPGGGAAATRSSPGRRPRCSCCSSRSPPCPSRPTSRRRGPRRETADANAKLEQALDAQTRQRERAEATSALALEALNRMYDRFAPTRLVVTPPATTPDGVELPAQPLLPPGGRPAPRRVVADLRGDREGERRIRGAAGARRRRRTSGSATSASGSAGSRQRRPRTGRPSTCTANGRRTRSASRSPGVTTNSAGCCGPCSSRRTRAGRSSAVQTLTAAPPAFAARPECRYELARAYYTLGQRDFLINPGPPPKKGWKLKVDGPPRPKGPPGDGFGPPPFGPPGDHPGEKAIALLKTLRDEYPKVPEYRHLLACCYRDVPPSPFGPKDDRPRPELAIDLLRELIRDFPKVPGLHVRPVRDAPDARPARRHGPGTVEGGD